MYPLLIEPGPGAQGPLWPAVPSNLASRRDQRLATFHPKCPLPPFFLHLSLFFFSLAPSPAWASLCIPPPLILFPLYSLSLSLSPSVSLSLPLLVAFLSHLHYCLSLPHISNYMPCLNNALYITPSLILFTHSPFHPRISLIRPTICSSSTHSSSSAMNPSFPHSLLTASKGIVHVLWKTWHPKQGWLISIIFTDRAPKQLLSWAPRGKLTSITPASTSSLSL